VNHRCIVRRHHPPLVAARRVPPGPSLKQTYCRTALWLSASPRPAFRPWPRFRRPRAEAIDASFQSARPARTSVCKTRERAVVARRRPAGPSRTERGMSAIRISHVPQRPADPAVGPTVQQRAQFVGRPPFRVVRAAAGRSPPRESARAREAADCLACWHVEVRLRTGRIEAVNVARHCLSAGPRTGGSASVGADLECAGARMSAVCISHVAPRPADPGGRALRRSAFPPRPAAVRAARAAAGRLRVVAGAARHAPSTTTEEGAVSRVEQFRCRQLPPMGLHGRLLVRRGVCNSNPRRKSVCGLPGSWN